MATPRSRLVDSKVPLFYHIISRCVRRAFLTGRDKRSGRDYSHRKQWFIDRLRHLAPSFAVEVYGYAIMSNHFHLVIYYDPQAAAKWSDEEVVDRWMRAFPRDESESEQAQRRAALLQNADAIADMRKKLGSISHLMKHLKQPIAWRANKEDKCKGHFFEQRFYSGAIVSENALIAVMAYVDLNPVRAKIARAINRIEDCGISERLKALEVTPAAIRDVLRPLVSGLAHNPGIAWLTFETYLEQLEQALAVTLSRTPDKENIWYTRIAAIKKRQRVYGDDSAIAAFAERQGLRRLDAALG